MLTSNPFAELSGTISSGVMQWYVILMVLAVIGGTVFDVIHKKSAKYFFENWRKAQSGGDRKIDTSEVAALAIQTGLVDVATSAEFCNPHRRIAHLLTMYGFIAYALSTVVLVFCYAGSASAGLWPFLWTLGALSICVGGYWFWFFIRADVSAEGQSPFRLIRADLFVVSLVTSATFALLWGLSQSTLMLGLYVIASTVLFCSVPWSKFAHMFFKPAAALQKRVAKADGSMDNLPKPADRNDPAVRNSHSMELLKDAPMDMGLGIKREQPKHY